MPVRPPSIAMKATTALQIVTFAVDVGGDVVLVHTRDGSTFRHPLARLPRVHSAGTFERSAGVIADDGFTVTWAVGGTLSVFQLAWDRLRTDTFSSCTAGYRDLSVLTPRQRSIVALTVLEADVYNGGFCSSSPIRASTSPPPRCRASSR